MCDVSVVMTCVVLSRMCAMRVAGDVLRLRRAVLGRRADHPVRTLSPLAARRLRCHQERERCRDLLPGGVSESLRPVVLTHIIARMRVCM